MKKWQENCQPSNQYVARSCRPIPELEAFTKEKKHQHTKGLIFWILSFPSRNGNLGHQSENKKRTLTGGHGCKKGCDKIVWTHSA
jgi:hypothetical protein